MHMRSTEDSARGTNMANQKAFKYCVVGNIVRERIDENGVLRYGTAAFKGGTRVYIEGKNYDYDYVRNGITVLGLNRHRRYSYEFVSKDHIENVRFTRTFKPTIMDMMYEYEGHDGWWGDSDEDGFDAKQFANNWPEFQKMKKVVFCDEPIKKTHRMHAPGFYEDMWEEVDYQGGITYHATEGCWLVFETEHHFITLGMDGVQIYNTAEALQQTGNILFNDMFELESIVFPKERIHDVSKNEQGWLVKLTDFDLRIICHKSEENFEGRGIQSEIPFAGFDHVLRPCLCGGRPLFKADRHCDFYVECAKCHRFTEPGYIPDVIVREWNEHLVYYPHEEPETERHELTRECKNLELIINMLETGKETFDISDPQNTPEDPLKFLRDYLQELKKLNSRIIKQGNTPELLKAVHDKYSELWTFQLLCSVKSLHRVIGPLWTYPKPYKT